VPRAEVIERERRFVTVPSRKPHHKSGGRGRSADTHSNIPPPVLRRGRHGNLTGRRRFDTGQRPDGDTGPVEFLELTSTVGTIDQVPGHTPMLHRDELSVEVGGKAIAEVPVREQVRGYLEFRQQAKRTPDPLERAEFEDHLFVAVEEPADQANFVGRQLSIEIGGEQLPTRIRVGD
jgi:hypothetical protein